MTVLVTGGAGYVGFNVIEALLAAGRDVVLFDRGALPAAMRRAAEPHASRLTVVEGDIRDADRLERTHAQYGIERVVHCAAITSGPEREAREPRTIVDVNLGGTINVLDAARRHGVKRVVYCNSASVYGESLYKLPRLFEDSPVVPLRLYSITKQAAERTCLRMRELWTVDAVSARLGNVIGPWERDTGARDIFDPHSQLASFAARGKEAILPRSEIRRDIVYSRDVAAGLIALLDAPAPRHAVYNLSAGDVWRGTLTMWCEALQTAHRDFRFRMAAEGETPDIVFYDKDRAPMDVGRMIDEFGFRPREPATAYAEYAEWIAANAGFFPDLKVT